MIKLKKIFKQIKNHIFISDLIFIGINIFLNFILYLFNIRFRLWVIIFIILISILGLVIGILQLIYLSKNKKLAILFSLLDIIPLLILIFIFMPIISFVALFSYKPEHVTTLENNKYVAVVSSFLHVDVDYYDYYGFLLMGTKVKIHGYFGKGGYDPFNSPNLPSRIEYTYYDNKGKVKEKIIRDKDGNIIDDQNYEDNTDKSTNNNDYLLPEDEKVLYEKKFGQTILRFGKTDDVLGQNMLVNVLRSKDNGKNFYYVSDEVIKVSDEAKFIFLNELLGFAINNGKIYLDNRTTGMYVTNDSGKTFASAVFNYQNENVEYISIKNLPYYEDNNLKIKCSVYQINTKKDQYEDKELIFISDDNGLTWNLDNN